MNVLIIEDEHALAAALSTIVRRLGAEPSVAASGQSGIEKLSRRGFDLVVLDIGLPDMSGLEVLRRIRAGSDTTPVLIITAHGTLDNALEAKRLGASDYFLKPLDLAEFQQALLAFVKQDARPAKAATPAHDSTIMIGAAPGMQRAYAAIAQACGTHAPVLISGESGTGKSLAARVIHANQQSSADGPLRVFRIDEWPAEKLHAALFGTEQTPGALAHAGQGTLFIEDVAALPLHEQAALEHTLDSSTTGAPRLVAATARNLLDEVRAGRFREDLYYRLKVVEVIMPALAQRTEDIPALAAFFLGQCASGTRQITLSEHALASLKAHAWPGNVRELRNAMQHAAAVCATPVVLPRHLPEAIARAGDGAGSASHLDSALQQALSRWLDQKLTAPEAELPEYDDLAAQVESMMLKDLLPRFDGKPTRLATALKMNRATLRKKCRDVL